MTNCPWCGEQEKPTILELGACANCLYERENDTVTLQLLENQLRQEELRDSMALFEDELDRKSGTPIPEKL